MNDMISIPVSVLSGIEISYLIKPSIWIPEYRVFERAGWLAWCGNQYNEEWKINLDHFRNMSKEEVIDEYNRIIESAKPDRNCSGLLKLAVSLVE